MKEKLLKQGYSKWKQPDNEPTLYQKKIVDKKGIKYFINCYHYISLKHPSIRESWEFRFQTESDFGTVNTILFNTENITVNQIESFMENTWINFGAKYYESELEDANVSDNDQTIEKEV